VWHHQWRHYNNRHLLNNYLVTLIVLQRRVQFNICTHQSDLEDFVL
jgi:hypothetical protein